MPKFTYSFERYEMKYLITQEQKTGLLELMKEYMIPDAFGKSSIRNIYLDTPDRRLIVNSLDHPKFKEKMRIRSYGTATDDDTVFVELKRKYKSVVYKRRVSMTNAEALDYVFGGPPPKNNQITREIDRFMEFYENLEPAMFISYEREAFFAKDDGTFRTTFDENILWRDRDLSLCKEAYGEPILPPETFLMEIKTAYSIPLWLTAFLSENGIFKTSFSKYGLAFSAQMNKKRNGSILNGQFI